MARQTRHPQAAADLIDIWVYVARDNPIAADRLLALIEAAAVRLSETPAMGHSRAELRNDLRSFSVGRYILFYSPLADGIELIRVLHSARDFDPLFDGL